MYSYNVLLDFDAVLGFRTIGSRWQQIWNDNLDTKYPESQFWNLEWISQSLIEKSLSLYKEPSS